MTSLLLVLALAQADPARDLVERLRSEKIEDREDAFRRLKELGRAAAAELGKAAADRDPEVAGRARKLLHLMVAREHLTPRLRAAMPGIEERLADGNDRTWVELLVELGDRESYPALMSEDLEPLLAPAFRAAAGDLELLDDLLDVCAERRIHEAVPELSRLLDHPKAPVRVHALQHLRAVGTREIAPRLLPLLRDADDRVRDRAWGAVVDLRASEAVPLLLEILKAPGEQDDLGHAVRVLGFLKAREAVPALVPLLKSERYDLRAYAAQSLGMIGAREETARIVPLLGDWSAIAREGGVEALRRLGAREAVPEVRRLLREEKIGPGEAIRLFVETGAREAIPEIRALLSKKCEGTCSDAVDALRDLGAREAAAEVARHLAHRDGYHDYHVPPALRAFRSKEAVPEVVKFLAHEEEEVRVHAADLLGFLHAESAVPALAGSLDPKETSAARAAEAALGRIGSVEAIAALRKRFDAGAERSWPLWSALAQRDPEFGPRLLGMVKEGRDRFKALVVGGSLGDAALLPPFVELLRDADRDGRRYGIEGVASRGSKEALPGILRLAAEKGEWIDHARSLALLGAKEAIPHLREALRDPRPEVRSPVACALATFGVKEAIPALRELLAGGDAGIRSDSIRALVEIGAKEAIPAMIERLRDPAPGNRREAMEALAILGAREAVPPLVRRLRDEDSGTAGQAALALACLGAKEAIPEIEKLFWSAGENAFRMLRESHQPRFALALARMGSTFGVDAMLEADVRVMPDYSTLNALRLPDAWRRLTEETVALSAAESVREGVDRLSRQAGRPVVFEEGTELPDPERRLHFSMVFTRGTVVDLLRAILSGAGLEFIVESDRIRVLPRSSARLFWLRWWREQGKKR